MCLSVFECVVCVCVRLCESECVRVCVFECALCACVHSLCLSVRALYVFGVRCMCCA